MATPIGRVLHFRCRLTSPFHTTRQEYANLWKCAPFVLGSTLRGALLSHLIVTHYDDVDIQAGAYETKGVVAPFFASPPCAYFSLGRFPDDVELQMESHTRITIERHRGSVAEGALLSIEAVPAGTPFEFDTLLPGDDGTLAQLVERGVREMVGTVGIGGLRSIGLGQFAVEDIRPSSLPDHVDAVRLALPSPLGQHMRLTFTTPYVLADGQSPWNGDLTELAQRLQGELQKAAHIAGVSAPVVQQTDARIRPDFVGRWSFEGECRENRLVAWPGSILRLQMDGSGDSTTTLAMALAFGIGEWAEWGFGRFEVAVERA